MHGPMLDRFIDDFSQRQVVDFIRLYVFFFKFAKIYISFSLLRDFIIHIYIYIRVYVCVYLYKSNEYADFKCLNLIEIFFFSVVICTNFVCQYFTKIFHS